MKPHYSYNDLIVDENWLLVERKEKWENDEEFEDVNRELWPHVKEYLAHLIDKYEIDQPNVVPHGLGIDVHFQRESYEALIWFGPDCQTASIFAQHFVFRTDKEDDYDNILEIQGVLRYKPAPVGNWLGEWLHERRSTNGTD